MENKVSDKNLAHIAQYNKALYDKVLMTNIEKSNLQLSTTAQGEYNLVLNGIELHSKDGAEKEAQIIAGNFEDNKDNIIIVYGLGLGYLPDTISKKCPESKIIVYEPNTEIIKFVLSIAEIDALYSGNTFLVSDISELSSILKLFATKNTDLSISFLTSYKNLFYEDILSVFQKTQDIISECVGNINTFTKKMPIASFNTFDNLKRMMKSPLVDELKDVYKDKTALILCAGPSLEENIEIVKKNQDKFVTFALNPTLQLLKKHSITPDFVVNIDVIDNLKQFNGIDLTNSYFITDIYTYHEVCALPSKKHFFYVSDTNFYNNWVKRAFKINNNYKNLGTSSYTALQCAIIMGFSKIIFTGQDLAYKNGKCYAQGCQFDMIECVLNKEKQQYEITVADFEAFKNIYKIRTMNEKQAQTGAEAFLKKMNNNLRTTKDKGGNLIPTKADYLIFIKIFEEAAKNIKNIELINSSNGADIKGYKNIPLDEALKDLKEVQKLDLTNYHTDFDLKNAKNEIEILENNLKVSYDILINFNDTASKLLKELETKKVITENIVKLIEKYKITFDKLTKQFENEDINNLLGVFAYDIYKILESNTLQDEKMIISAIRSIIPLSDKMSLFLKHYIKNLHDCQTLIF